MKSAPPVGRFSESRSEMWAYVVAALVLVVGGMIFRTPILNWICGPAIVISCVVFLGPIFAGRSNGGPSAAGSTMGPTTPATTPATEPTMRAKP